MSENVKINNMLRRFGHFVGQKPGEKTADDISKSFKKRIENMEAEDQEQPRRTRSNGARRHQPPRIAKLGQDKGSDTPPEIPKLGKARNISLKHARRLAQYAPLIEDAARRHNVPVELICGVILQESGANHKAVSHCGARGLMQLMPATARRFGVKNSFDPAQNIEGGTKYLRWLLDRFDGNLELSVAAYNAGEGNVEKYGNKIPPFKETQNYVPAVLGFTQSMVEVFAEKMAYNMPAYAKKA
jgi:hypothetical protein